MSFGTSHLFRPPLFLMATEPGHPLCTRAVAAYRRQSNRVDCNCQGGWDHWTVLTCSQQTPLQDARCENDWDGLPGRVYLVEYLVMQTLHTCVILISPTLTHCVCARVCMCVCRVWDVASGQCTATLGRDFHEEYSDDDEDGGRERPAAKDDATLDGHKSSVYNVAISGDGHTLVSGSCDQSVK